VVSRYREEKDIVQAILSTGAAVALCSWTTIVGYGSLLAARNRALQGFGAMAILGEVACLSTAIIAMPAAVLWWQGRRARRRGASADSADSSDSSGSSGSGDAGTGAADVQTGTAL